MDGNQSSVRRPVGKITTSRQPEVAYGLKETMRDAVFLSVSAAFLES